MQSTNRRAGRERGAGSEEGELAAGRAPRKPEDKKVGRLESCLLTDTTLENQNPNLAVKHHVE